MVAINRIRFPKKRKPDYSGVWMWLVAGIVLYAGTRK